MQCNGYLGKKNFARIEEHKDDLTELDEEKKESWLIRLTSLRGFAAKANSKRSTGCRRKEVE